MKLLLTSDLHRDGSKLLWILDDATSHDAVIVAGDMLDIFSNTPPSEQTVGAIRWRNAVLSEGRSFAWCSGNHDFFNGDHTPMKAASPLWMQEVPSSQKSIGDGETRVLVVGEDRIAITTIPWPVHGGDLQVNGGTVSYHEFVTEILHEGQQLQREMPWIVLCHEPPIETPLATTYDAPEAKYARLLIESSRPDFSIHGHVHQAPMSPGGLWIWQLGATICFNAGQADKGERPHHIILELRSRTDWTATWHGCGRTLRAESSGQAN